MNSFEMEIGTGARFLWEAKIIAQFVEDGFTIESGRKVLILES